MDKERKPIIYNVQNNTGYDGKQTFHISKEFRNDIYDFKTDYILINKDKRLTKDVDGKKVKLTDEEEYKYVIDMANTLKRETKGVINMYKTGGYKVTALNLFDKMTKHIQHPPKLTQVESIFIDDSSTGSMIFSDNTYKGPAHKADIKSQYPSLMNSKMLFPIGEGELLFLSEFPKDYLKYGVYHCEITLDKTKTKIFRFNQKNKYTHIDINHAKEIGLDVKLIIDGQPNFLYYSRDKLLTGTELFGNYINFMFDLKQRKINGAIF